MADELEKSAGLIRARKRNSSENSEDAFRDLRWVSSALGSFTVVSLLLSWWYGYALVRWRFQPQTLWAIGIWSAGAGVGFLFAIPKVLQGRGVGPASSPTTKPTDSSTSAAQAPADPLLASGYQQRVNTNLEEISDWLTKIIIGMTLVELKQIPGLVWRLSAQVVADLPGATDGSTSPHMGYGIAVIVTFSVLGFLFGYLVTRLYLQGALARAERGLGEEGRLELQRRALSAETRADLLSGVAEMPVAATMVARAKVEPAAPVQEQLRKLGEEYRNLNIADWAERTRAKNRIAAALFQVVAKEGISRDWLAEADDEILVLALASAVHALPEPGDAERLLKAAPKAKLKHVRYAVVMAFGRLLESRLVPPDLRADIRAVLISYLDGADRSLVDVTRAVLNQLSPS